VLTGVSLFAGVGGFDLAMTRKGIKVVATVEIDKKCNEVLAKRFPDAKQFTDVQEITGKDLIDAGFIPTNGIITGGFPCQDLSVAGKRAGLAGARSGLFWEIRRLVEETQTEWFILENVPGLLSSNSGKDFGIVLGEMADLRYSIGWRVLDAQYFGVPQRRRRIFIVGSRTGGAERIFQVLFERQGVRRDTTQSQQERQDSTDSAAGSVRKASLSSGKDIANCIPAELYHKSTIVNQDVNNGHLVLQQDNILIGPLQARDYKGVGNQYVAENKLVVEQK